MADPAARPIVLVADDDPLVRTVVRMALQGMGADVVEARSADEIAGLDARLAIAVAVLDVNMPGADVLSTIALLRGRDPAPKVLLVSGEEAPRGREEADAFARKPVDLAKFEELVSSLLAPSGSGSVA